MELHRAVGLEEGVGYRRKDDTCVRASPDAWLNFLSCWLKDGDGMPKGVDRFRRILVRLGSICLQSLTGQRLLLEFVIICRNILHALRNFELRVCDVLAAQVNFCSQVANVSSAALQSTNSCPKLSPHSTLEYAICSFSLPSCLLRHHTVQMMTFSRGVGEDFPETIEKKKTMWCNTQTPVTKHCIVLATWVGFLTALRCLSPALRDRETN